MCESGKDSLTQKDRRYIEGLRQVARFGWLIYVFIGMLALNVAAAAYFAKAIAYHRDIIVWQSVSQCITLLFFIIFFREKLVAHRVISRLMKDGEDVDGDAES